MCNVSPVLGVCVRQMCFGGDIECPKRWAYLISTKLGCNGVSMASVEGMCDRSFIKPDVVGRSLVGETFSRHLMLDADKIIVID